jgi:hypothetical protein
VIKQLTPEQIARFPEFINKWTRVELSCEPADRPRAEAAIRSMYEAGGLPPPEKIIWFDSPMAMFVEYKKTNNRSVRNTVRNTVWNAVYGAVHDAVGNSAFGAVYNAVGSIVWDAVRNAVDSIVWDTFVSSTTDGVIHGSCEAHWLVKYDYYREVLGLVKETDKLVGLFELAKSCGWIIPCEKICYDSEQYNGRITHHNISDHICYASERHNILNRDSKGKLHCEDGPAISYPDGWGVYIDHGVVVPEKVVMDPGGFTLKELKELKTHEVKIVFRKIGMEKFMSIPGTRRNSWTKLFNEIAKETMND